MTGVTGVSNNGTQVNQSNRSGQLEVNQNQFIELFVAQLKNQDPLAPMDTNQMLTQLSQISSVESLNSIHGQISGLTSSLQQSQALGAAGLVGQNVWVNGNRVSVDSPSELKGQASLPLSSSEVLIRVYDSAGSVIQSKSLGAHSAGMVPFTLDELPKGNYVITATGVNGDEAYAGGVMLQGSVTGVGMDASGARLKLDGLGDVSLSSVLMIGN